MVVVVVVRVSGLQVRCSQRLAVAVGCIVWRCPDGAVH